MSTGLKANSDGSAAIQVGGTDVITLTSGGAATFVTSPTTVQAGTAAAPSITFSGDTNTGIYSPGADQVAIATGGSKRFEVDAAGNAGLGIAPSAWNNQYRFMQFTDATSAFVGGSPYSAQIGQNAYINSSSQWIYGGSAYRPSRYEQFDGIHYFLSAGSGTAGNVITFTEALSFRKDETLALQGASRSAGTGIAFPATQSASSNANTLDDYEEGNWTPTLFSSGATFTYGANTGGVYVKIGRFVQLHGVIALTNRTGGTAGNGLSISNLPFAPGNPDFSGSGTGITMTSISSGITVPANSVMWTAAVRSGTSVFPYYSSTNGGGITLFQYGQITATMTLQFALSYYTDA